MGGNTGDEEGAGERAEQVEQRVLSRRGLPVAGPRHLGRLHDGRLGGAEHVVRLLGKRRRASSPDAAELNRRQRGQGGPGQPSQHNGAPVGLEGLPPPHVQCSSRSSSGTWRTLRAGTPITTARGPTSRATTAPAATKASSPTSTPGSSTAPPPTRHARRSRAPRNSSPARRRPIVWSFVSVTPGATNTSSSTTDHAVM